VFKSGELGGQITGFLSHSAYPWNGCTSNFALVKTGRSKVMLKPHAITNIKRHIFQ
jgi:hypothetical protein